MTLFNAYLALAAALAVAGGALFLAAPGTGAAASLLRGFPRSLPAALALFGGATAWFIHSAWMIGDADLANFPRIYLAVFFGGAAALAFVFLRDLLAVRGLAALMLLFSRALLDAGYMRVPSSILLAATSYALVICGLWWGVRPYTLRDILEWLLAAPLRARAAGGVLLTLAAANLAAAFITSPSAP